MSRLMLRLLGGFEVLTGPGEPLAVPTRKAQALIAYLALTPDQMHPRDKLAALLWGDHTPGSARNALRQTLFVLRKALGSEARAMLVITSDAITLAPDVVETDVAAFLQALAERTPAALEHAAALYRGDLLAGLTVAEPAFEDWLMSERERLRELALEGGPVCVGGNPRRSTARRTRRRSDPPPRGAGCGVGRTGSGRGGPRRGRNR